MMGGFGIVILVGEEQVVDYPRRLHQTIFLKVASKVLCCLGALAVRPEASTSVSGHFR
jgi:hypothetical protein